MFTLKYCLVLSLDRPCSHSINWTIMRIIVKISNTIKRKTFYSIIVQRRRPFFFLPMDFVSFKSYSGCSVCCCCFFVVTVTVCRSDWKMQFRTQYISSKPPTNNFLLLLLLLLLLEMIDQRRKERKKETKKYNI